MNRGLIACFGMITAGLLAAYLVEHHTWSTLIEVCFICVGLLSQLIIHAIEEIDRG